MPYKLPCFCYYKFLDFQLYNMRKVHTIRKKIDPNFGVVMKISPDFSLITFSFVKYRF